MTDSEYVVLMLVLMICTVCFFLWVLSGASLNCDLERSNDE